MVGKESGIFVPREIGVKPLVSTRSKLDVPELTKDLDKQALEKLSKREFQVLESFSNGNNPKETGEILSLHRYSVSRIFISARIKLGLNSPQIILLYMDAKKRNALPPKEYSSLTDKKKRIFKLIVSGHSRKQMAKKLNVTKTSIASSYDEIFKSFGASSLTELLIKLVNMKILDPHKYIEDVKKENNNFLKNVDTASNISSLLLEINEKEMAVLNAFITSIIKGGGQNKEIADLLGKPKHQVANHFASISKKLGGAKRGHIAMWYIAATNEVEE